MTTTQCVSGQPVNAVALLFVLLTASSAALGAPGERGADWPVRDRGQSGEAVELPATTESPDQGSREASEAAADQTAAPQPPSARVPLARTPCQDSERCLTCTRESDCGVGTWCIRGVCREEVSAPSRSQPSRRQPWVPRSFRSFGVGVGLQACTAAGFRASSGPGPVVLPAAISGRLSLDPVDDVVITVVAGYGSTNEGGPYFVAGLGGLVPTSPSDPHAYISSSVQSSCVLVNGSVGYQVRLTPAEKRWRIVLVPALSVDGSHSDTQLTLNSASGSPMSTAPGTALALSFGVEVGLAFEIRTSAFGVRLALVPLRLGLVYLDESGYKPSVQVEPSKGVWPALLVSAMPGLEAHFYF